jgi:hypothetical protein
MRRPNACRVRCALAAAALVPLAGLSGCDGRGVEDEFVLARGTSFAVRLATDVDRARAQPGQPIEGTVVSALAGEGGSLPASGWTIAGAVAPGKPPPARGRGGSHAIAWRALRPPGQPPIAIRAETVLSDLPDRGLPPGVVSGRAIAGAILDRELERKGIRPAPGPGAVVVARLLADLRLPRRVE